MTESQLFLPRDPNLTRLCQSRPNICTAENNHQNTICKKKKMWFVNVAIKWQGNNIPRSFIDINNNSPIFLMKNVNKFTSLRAQNQPQNNTAISPMLKILWLKKKHFCLDTRDPLTIAALGGLDWASLAQLNHWNSHKIANQAGSSKFSKVFERFQPLSY